MAALDALVDRCDFIQHAADNAASLSYDEWFSLATVLRVFPLGESLFDELSRRDPARYRAREIPRKLRSIRGKPRHCDSLGWSCPRRGECAAIGVRSPAGLPFKLLTLRRRTP